MAEAEKVQAPRATPDPAKVEDRVLREGDAIRNQILLEELHNAVRDHASAEAEAAAKGGNVTDATKEVIKRRKEVIDNILAGGDLDRRLVWQVRKETLEGRLQDAERRRREVGARLEVARIREAAGPQAQQPGSSSETYEVQFRLANEEAEALGKLYDETIKELS